MKKRIFRVKLWLFAVAKNPDSLAQWILIAGQLIAWMLHRWSEKP